MKKSRLKYIKDRRVKVLNILVNKFKESTNIDLTEKVRDQGFDSPLWNRAVFYGYLNTNMGYDGSMIAKTLNIDHATGIHYRDNLNPYLNDSFSKQYEKRVVLISDLFKKSYLQSFNS